MKLAEAFAKFDLQMRADGRSVHTCGNYRRHVELLGRWLAAYGFSDELGEITPEVLAAFLTSDEARTSERGGTCASRLARRGVEVAVTAKLLGHSTVEMTLKHYTKLDLADLRHAVETNAPGGNRREQSA
jgi:site-specific recombinase XerD